MKTGSGLASGTEFASPWVSRQKGILIPLARTKSVAGIDLSTLQVAM